MSGRNLSPSPSVSHSLRSGKSESGKKKKRDERSAGATRGHLLPVQRELGLNESVGGIEEEWLSDKNLQRGSSQLIKSSRRGEASWQNPGAQLRPIKRQPLDWKPKTGAFEPGGAACGEVEEPRGNRRGSRLSRSPSTPLCSACSHEDAPAASAAQPHDIPIPTERTLSSPSRGRGHTSSSQLGN